MPVNYHLLLVALCNCLLLEASCCCYQRCFWIKTLELKLWSPGGKGAALVLKSYAGSLWLLSPGFFWGTFRREIKLLKGCSVSALLWGENGDDVRKETCHTGLGQLLKQIATDYFGKRWKWGIRSAMQKDLFQGCIDGHQRSVGQMRSEQIACVRSAGWGMRQAQRSTAKGCWHRCHHRQPCPLQSASPHHGRGGCLNRDSPGTLGLAISVGPAHLVCGCCFAKEAQSPWYKLLWIPLCATDRLCISSAHMGYLWKGTVYLFVLSM